MAAAVRQSAQAAAKASEPAAPAPSVGGGRRIARAPSRPTPPAPTLSHAVQFPRVQTSLRMSSPGDPAEREAETVARRVMAMPEPPRVGQLGGPLLARQAAAAPLGSVTSDELSLASVGGAPLPSDLRGFMERRFRTDFSGVRVHTDERASRLATRMGARAFAYGGHLFFARDQYRPATPEGAELIAHELTHTIQQGAVVQSAAAPMVRQAAPARVQRFGISDALDWVADKANNIPGFRMFTIVLGINPINMSRVERSAANILRALVEFMPGGGLIVQALDQYGVFDRAGAWLEQQVAALGLTGAAIRQSVMDFLDSLGLRDLFHLGDVWDRAVRIFTTPIDRLITLARNAVAYIITVIKDAILRPLAELASRTRAWDLLIAVLGRNPITGEAVPRTADTLIGGFMKLIGQEEVWENIKRANAIPRAWAWFQGVLQGVLAFVSALPGQFLAVLRSLGIEDIVHPIRAFERVAGTFGAFVGDFVGWAGRQVLALLEIIFEVVAPAAIPYLKRAAGAFRDIIRNPVRFVGLLVRSGIQGFRQFASRFLTHLRTALVGWLTGTLAGANIYIPQAFSFVEILKFVLSVLGLTWQNIRSKLVRAVGETAVGLLEKGFDIVVTLFTQGPAAAWQKIQEGIGNLRDMVIEQVMTFVRDTIVQRAITTLLTSLNPAGAFIQAIIATYNTIMFFVERIRQIAQVAASFIDALATIVAGNIQPAADRVERTMAGLLVLVISFLARITGLSRVSDVVLDVIKRVRQPIDRALDKVVDWIVAAARKVRGLLVSAGSPEDQARRLNEGMEAAAAAVARFSGTRVGAVVLRPLLAAIRLRYRLQRLELVEDGDNWAIFGQINPSSRRRTDAKRQLAEAQAIKVGDFIRIISTLRPIGRIERVATDASGQVTFAEWTNINATQSVKGGRISTSDVGRLWRLAHPNEFDIPDERLAELNKEESWPDANTARRVLNYRYSQNPTLQNNPSGKEWEHIQEQSRGGAHSSSNLALTDAELNRDLGQYFGRSYVIGEVSGVPSTGGAPLRDFLAGQPTTVHVQVKLRFYTLSGYKLSWVQNPVGKYQVLAK